MQTPGYYWPPEQTAIVREFVTKYPKGTSFNVAQVKYAEADKWKILIDAGRTPQSIYAKGRYERGETSKQKAVKKPRTQPRTIAVMKTEKPSHTQGWHYCPNCSFPLDH